jgi:hypothetical protein
MRLFGVLVALCQSAAAQPRYDQTIAVATHNSYWVPRDSELGASGSGERILDQLLHDRVRSLELDIHTDGNHPGEWAVYHTTRNVNSVCTSLAECLEQLRLFHYLDPNHDVINVVIELKELWGRAFRRTHTVEQLDALVRTHLGDTLYAPADFLRRCPGMRLRACAARVGWPSAESLRGKIIVTILGNWNLNAQDWVDYATHSGGVRARAAFPMRSLLRPNGVTRAFGFFTAEMIDRQRQKEAFDESIFWQVEDSGAVAEVQRFLDEHGIVRSSRVAGRIQLVQTDEPWRFGDREPAERRILARGPLARGFWEAFAATTHAAEAGVGCLRATTERGWLSVCRQVTRGEHSRIFVETNVDSSAASATGELFALDIDAHCIAAFSAAELRGTLPAWHFLTRLCSAGAITEISANSSGHVRFVGLRAAHF